jgi:hypothetical protein
MIQQHFNHQQIILHCADHIKIYKFVEGEFHCEIKLPKTFFTHSKSSIIG